MPPQLVAQRVVNFDRVAVLQPASRRLFFLPLLGAGVPVASSRSILCRSISLSGVAAPRLFHSIQTAALLRYHWRASAAAARFSSGENERSMATRRLTLPKLSLQKPT